MVWKKNLISIVYDEERQLPLIVNIPSATGIFFANLCLENMTVAERMQIMGHSRPEIYDKHYLNEIVESDTLGILLETPSNKRLMSLATHMSLTKDPNAPAELTTLQRQEIMNSFDMVKLRAERDAKRQQLDNSDKVLKKAKIIDPKGFEEYELLRRRYDALRSLLMRQKFEQVREDYFSTVGARYIEEQHTGSTRIELPAPTFEVPEREPLASLLFPKVNAELELEETLDWPSDAHHCHLIDLLVSLCSKRCLPERKSKQDEKTIYIEVEEDETTPDLYPIVCPSTLCLFCLGDTSLPLESRTRHFPKTSNLKRHVVVQHLRHQDLGVGFECPHPGCCENRILKSNAQYFNHAAIVHNVLH
jgi:Protein of unknown function (DUF3435)